MHIKDIDPVRATRVRPSRNCTQTFSDGDSSPNWARGLWTFPPYSPFEQAGFSGWLIVETDVTQQPSALLSAQISRAYLKSLGI